MRFFLVLIGFWLPFLAQAQILQTSDTIYLVSTKRILCTIESAFVDRIYYRVPRENSWFGTEAYSTSKDSILKINPSSKNTAKMVLRKGYPCSYDTSLAHKPPKRVRQFTADLILSGGVRLNNLPENPQLNLDAKNKRLVEMIGLRMKLELPIHFTFLTTFSRSSHMIPLTFGREAIHNRGSVTFGVGYTFLKPTSPIRILVGAEIGYAYSKYREYNKGRVSGLSVDLTVPQSGLLVTVENRANDIISYGLNLEYIHTPKRFGGTSYVYDHSIKWLLIGIKAGIRF